jgi:F0F1-type ATP synthase assembly protein I
MQENNKKEKRSPRKIGGGMVIGIGIGVAIGVATDNLAVWIGVGVALGLAFGAVWDSQTKQKDDSQG